MVLVALITAGLAGSAAATHNVTYQHWSFGYTYYHLVTNTLEARYVTAIVNGANKWTNQTAVDYYRGADQSSANWSDTNTHLIWMGTIPSAWQTGCPVSTSIACTTTSVGGDNHIIDSDTVMDSTDGWTDTCPWWLFAFNDMESLALHELGHWGRLTHSSGSDDVMSNPYDTCDQTLSTHDIGAMNQNYVH
jgi:hypothetical protein